MTLSLNIGAERELRERKSASSGFALGTSEMRGLGCPGCKQPIVHAEHLRFSLQATAGVT